MSDEVQAIATLLNNSGMTRDLATLKSAILSRALTGLVHASAVQDPNAADARSKHDLMLLNSVGPAAAANAVSYAMKLLNQQGRAPASFTSNSMSNYRMVANDASVSDSIRQYLIPRYGGSFDAMVDPKHLIDIECGYPKYITPSMYRYMYDRDDVACRVNDIFPDESWAVDPDIYEDPDETVETEFEKAWKELCEDHNILQMLYRLDKLTGVGRYGVLLFGVDGENSDLERPIQESELLSGNLRAVAKKRRNLLYLRPFDEYLSFIQEYESDPNSPRCGLPTYYSLVFSDLTTDASGAMTTTQQNVRVHWTRILHSADGKLQSLFLGKPRQQSCFNRLLDLRKIKGSSAEMFWKGGFPGISFEINPEFAADNPEYDEEGLKREIEAYANGLQRYLRTMGVSAKSMAPAIADPASHVAVQLTAIASHVGVPLRIFLGSEEGRLASTQDKLTWNQRLRRRLRTFVEPDIIRAFINRLIAIGVLPKPKQLFITWSDLNTLSDEDKANLSLKWTQALSQYVSTGIIHMIRPMDYLTTILGVVPSEAKKILATIESSGGMAKLLSVDPSQGAGVNGKRENITSTDSNVERGASVKRDTADKKAEGTAS